MKNLIILFLFVCSTSVSCQTNQLSAGSYNNVKFDNILLSDIINTKGDSSTLQSIISDQLTINTGEDPDHWIEFQSNSIYLLFQDGERLLSSNISDYQLTNIKLLDNTKSILINGINVSVGDNISVFGNIDVLTYSDGVKRIVFKIGSEVIRISYNELTNIITLIEYVYYNS